MRQFAKATLGALLFAAAMLATTLPASAYVDVGISFGFAGPGYTFDPCDYYDYYDAPPPWGLPPDYCEYPVYFEPVFYGGFWYRGPIYYRWYHGDRVFWLNGGWHADGWRGGPRPNIDWQSRGGWNNGFRPGMRPGPGFQGPTPREWRAAPHGWRGGPPSAGSRPWFNGGRGWTGGERPFAGPPPGPGPRGGPPPWTGGGRPPDGGPPPWAGGGRGPEDYRGGPPPRGGFPGGGSPRGGFPGGGHPGGGRARGH
jgi:hypothetical protein